MVVRGEKQSSANCMLHVLQLLQGLQFSFVSVSPVNPSKG